MPEAELQTRKASVLVADDEDDLLDIMRLALGQIDVQLTFARNGHEAIRYLEEQTFDLVVSDQNMPGPQGTDILEFARNIKPDPPLFILITAFGTIDMAVEAMRSGAYDFLKKPFEIEEFVSRVRNALDTRELAQENRLLKQTVEAHYLFTEIVAESKAMRDVLELARRASEKSSTVLLLGESGTGKDLLARAIHFHGPFAKKPFIPINCGAIPENLMESEFFGHKKGSFTGAVADRHGCFEEAKGGTVFLDEIGEMAFDLQVKLLRVLEEGKIRRIGENIERSVDFRIIAATNQDIEDMIREKLFRQDLFYRLNVLTLTIPPLRLRREDILPLANHFLRQSQEETGAERKSISPGALDFLYEYDYPGNVRELANIIQRAVLLCDGDTLEPSHLPPDLRDLDPGQAPEPDSFNLKEETRKAQENVELRLIAKALEKTGNNHKKAAELLGISRGSLYNKLQKPNKQHA